MKKKFFQILFLSLGLLLCMTMFVGFLLFGPAASGANEILSAQPKLTRKDGSVNDAFLSQLSDWFSDRFYPRQRLITAYAEGNALLFRQSASEDVLVGKDGWLYYASTLRDFTGTDGMNSRELYSAARNLALMQQHCESRNADFVFLCARNKNTLYPRFMPDYGAEAAERDGDRLQRLLTQMHVNSVDLLPVFSAVEKPLYFAHDSHWNSRGAALAADELNAALGRSSRYFSGNFSRTEPHTGDLFEMLYPAGRDDETDPVYGGTLSYTFAEKSGTRPDSISIRTESGGEGSLLMYRDSFGNLLYPYLADSFGQAYFSRATAYDLTEPADAVVIELVERNLRYLIRNLPIMPAPEAAAEWLPGTGSAAVTAAAAQELPGYRRWEGTAPNADPQSPVCLLAGGKLYECFLLEGERFAAYLPESSTVTDIVYTIQGQTTAFSAELAG